MDLTTKQVRRYLLAGTVGFPTPFPSVGTISIEGHRSPYPSGPRDETFVVVQENRGICHALARMILKDQVRAIFVPGETRYDAQGNPTAFEFAHTRAPVDFDKGTWFVEQEIDAATMAKALSVNEQRIADRDTSPVRGIVFVDEHARVISFLEANETAGGASDWFPAAGCDPRPRSSHAYIGYCD